VFSVVVSSELTREHAALVIRVLGGCYKKGTGWERG
jgi:hypothetical protein